MKRPILGTETQRLRFLAVSGLSIMILLLIIDPIAQDPAYHQFADESGCGIIPNWQNVLSNIPFAIVGLLGVWHLLSIKEPSMASSIERSGWLIFFIGVFLTAWGSGYYHWKPDNWGLFWDRLPMTIGFSGLFASIIGERVSQRAYQLLLWPLVISGLASVVYWIATENGGRGDLRPYAFVQFFPLLSIPCMMWLCPARYTHSPYILIAIGCYVLAKITEDLDTSIWVLTKGVTSGHALKHLFAALGCYFILRMLKIRQIIVR